MKCQKCQKQATFHITDLTGDDLLALHLCPDCAKQYLKTDETPEDASAMSGVLQKQLKPLEQAAADLSELDSKECPICGISFFEFRQAGRLGCPHDYVFFGSELEPLLVNVHGDNQHVGKQPKRGVRDTESQTELIRLRRQMKEVIEREEYEEATKLRDQIRAIEGEGQSGD
ncbi:MAG: protein arginine kinase activator [Mariniblastus sp.]|jgi:protein arginine kinase activator